MELSKLVYLAAPFWHDDPEIRQARVECVTMLAGRLSRMGLFVYSPLTYGYACELAAGFWKIGEPYWHEHSAAMLRFASVLGVLRLPGWADSKGVARECVDARNMSMSIVEIAPIYVGGLGGNPMLDEFDPAATALACAGALSLAARGARG